MIPHLEDDNDPTVNEALATSKLRAESEVFQEVSVSGFSHIDQEIAFFTQVAALIRPHHVLLDFGAGRGEFFLDEPVRYRRLLQNFRGRVSHVDGCDIDKAVLSNPSLDSAQVIRPGEPLPYEDGRFDVVISRYVFEHIEDPEWAAGELLRVTKPGGWICAVTPNKWGYVAIGARLIPNRLHRTLLKDIQPHRKSEDVFPTAYRLNTPSDLKRYFSRGGAVYHYTNSAVPSYHFGSPLILRLLLLIHRLLPSKLDLSIAVFVQRNPGAQTSAT